MEKIGGNRKSCVHSIIGFFSVLTLFFFVLSVQQNINFKHWTTIYLEEKNESDAPDIIFLETSKKLTLTLREACSVESAALHNPELTVRVFSMREFNTHDGGYMEALINVSNVFVATLNLSEVFQGTPLKTLYESGMFSQSSYPMHHISDASRLALLWKLGGIYLDTDTVTLQPLGGLHNALGLQYDEDVANGVLFFSKGNPFLNICMTEFASDYQPSAWGHQGPLLITRELKKACNVTRLAMVIDRPKACKGIRLLPQHALLPVGWRNWRSIVMVKDLSKFNFTGSYMVHFYGSLSHNTLVRTGSGVLLDALARENCPRMYEWMLRQKEF